MLEYLNVKLDGMGVGESSLNIWMKNGRLRYAYDTALSEEGPAMILNVSGDRAASFLKNLENLQLYRWKGRYFDEKKITLSEKREFSSRWYILYKEVGQEAREFQGENAYPEGFSSLMGMISDLTAEVDSRKRNSLSTFTLEVRDRRERLLWNPLSREEDSVEVEYQEFLYLSRRQKKLIYQQFINRTSTAKHEYNVPDIADYLLGNIERYFSSFQTEEQKGKEEEAAEVTIGLHYLDGHTRILKRSYDRYGLPDDWEDLLEDFHKTLAYHGVFGAIFDAGLYHHGVKKGEYIYLSCIFEPNGKSYYYRSKEDNLSIGDFVLVPSAMQENAETVVMISDILYCREENVPFPLEKTKFILRKIDEGEFYSFSAGDNPDQEA
jgi:hypothetical protein